jgi:hypothetical protein
MHWCVTGRQLIQLKEEKKMKKQLFTTILIAFIIAVTLPTNAYCQTETPNDTTTPTDDLLSIATIVVVVLAIIAVIGGVSAFIFMKKKRVDEKSLRKVPSQVFEEWVLKKFNGKPSDPSTGVTGFTEGGQPLLIVQSDHTSLAEVEDFVKVLTKGKAQKGTIVAFNFDKDTIEGKVAAMDNGIELQLLRVYELLNKHYANRIKTMASSQVTFEATAAYEPGPTESITTSMTPEPLEKGSYSPAPSQNTGFKPRVFISNSNTKVSEQVKKMLDFLHYEYVMGDKEETSVPISDSKFGLMKNCDCAIINIAAAEQERRYSGIYVLNSNVTSEINAAYLKYDTQVVLLVERKVDLPPNLKGLKRIEYDSDDLSFNAAMDLKKALEDFKKIWNPVSVP